MRFGRTVPDGFLPVFSVDTEEEARQLIIAACPRDDQGTHYARELAHEQTLENLQAFSDKLARTWTLMQERKAARQANAPGQRNPPRRRSR